MSVSKELGVNRPSNQPAEQVTIPDSWVTSRAAVDAFASWCTGRKWVFQPMDGSTDFGKDGFVEISTGGSPTGEIFAVQLKGGASWRASGGYRIPIGKHRRSWRDSTIPVIGVVHDKALRWANLTTALRSDPDCASVLVPDSARLDTPAQADELMRSVHESVRSGAPMEIGSPLPEQQRAAVWDCFALGRKTPDALVVLRRSFLAMDARARRDAVVALAHCTPHPDVFWTNSNWLPPEIQKAVCSAMEWSVPEAWQLLALIGDEGGFERGTFGQHIYMLLAQSSDCAGLMRRTLGATIYEDPQTATWALLLLLYLSGTQAPEEWARLVQVHPDLREVPLAAECAEALRDFGYVTLF